jgi:hypothetical protein
VSEIFQQFVVPPVWEILLALSKGSVFSPVEALRLAKGSWRADHRVRPTLVSNSVTGFHCM